MRYADVKDVDCINKLVTALEESESRQKCVWGMLAVSPTRGWVGSNGRSRVFTS